MSSKRPPPMPKVSPPEGEIERHDAYRRLNPNGDEELVVRRRGKKDEETLNELADYLLSLIEGQYTSSKNSADCDGAVGVQAECFVGTDAIAIGTSPPRRKKKRGTKLESEMKNRRPVISEWAPPFKAAGYSPGEHQMDKPEGEGVAAKSPTQDSVGKYDTELSKVGKEWPVEHNDTEVMDGVDDENISDSATGAHESTHGEPDDGHQEKVGHNWPDQPKNSGQGVAEPFEGDRWSDGGVLPAGTAPKGEGVPNVHAETWNPDHIGSMLGEDADIQSLFDSYARSTPAVCLEGFQQLLAAHGVDALLDTTSMLQLMEDNQEFVFYEGEDADGLYWARAPLNEEGPPPGPKGEDEGDFDDEDLGPLDDDLSAGAGPGGLGMGSPAGSGGMGGPEMSGGLGGIDALAMGMDDGEDWDDSRTDGLECPGCGYMGDEAECPECGGQMVDPFTGNPLDADGFSSTGAPGMGDLPGAGGMGMGGPTGPGMGGLNGPDMANLHTAGGPTKKAMGFNPVGGPNPMAQGARDAGVTKPGQKLWAMGSEGKQSHSPQIAESLKNFLHSAKSMIEGNPKANGKSMAEALNHSWQYHAGKVDARACSTKIKSTLEGLMSKYPGFNPLMETEAMGKPEGTKLTGGDGPKVELPSPSTDTKEMKDKNLLGASQKNTLEGTPTISGTGKGMSESIANKNIARLNAHVRRHLQEGSQALGQGKFKVKFSVLVKEGTTKNRTEVRDSLAEALADTEELLQLHNAEDVALEASFVGPTGQIHLKQDVPLFTIDSRGPVQAEGKSLFRFNRTAEAFAEALVNEGVTCRVGPHTWGSAVEARADSATVNRAFKMVAESCVDDDGDDQCNGSFPFNKGKKGKKGKKPPFAKSGDKGGKGKKPWEK
jgi:hypothetical protein